MNRIVKFWTRRDDIEKPRAPDGVRLYGVGDIHGHDALLVEMLAAIDRDIDSEGPARNIVVFLGDLIDRGPDSAGVVERLRTLARPYKTVFLTGNHEEVLVRILDGDDQLVGDWLRFGGLQCAKSYGLDPARLRSLGQSQAGQAIRQAIPEAHQKFLRSFADSFGAGDYLFVHAGIRPNVDLAQQSLTDLRWIRSPFLECRHRHPKMIVHGHSISKDVEFRPGRIGVDTGAYRSGVLSAVVFEGTDQRILQVGRDKTGQTSVAQAVENRPNDC